MNIWTQFLPGFRESRIPLAVGSLWVTAAALLIRHLPASLLEGELVGEVRRLVKLLPGPVAGAAAFFGVYLLGVILHEAGGIVVRMVAAILHLTPLVIAAFALLLGVKLLPLLLITAAISVVVTYNNWRQLKDVPYPEYYSQALNRTLASALRAASSAWDAVVTAWDPSRAQIDYIMREESNRALASTAALRQNLLEGLPIRRLADVVRAVRLQDSDLQKRQPVSGARKEAITVSKALRRLKIDPDLPPIIRAAVGDRIAVNAEARRAFISAAINTTRLRRDVKDRVDRAHVHLRANYEMIYDQYDRLRAEGEFRIAVATPLGAALGAASYLIAEDGVVGSERSVWLYIGSAVAALSMLAAGGTKKTESSQLLYSSIRQQLVQKYR